MTSTTEIMHEMDRTRDEIRATLEAIEGRLSVENVVQHLIVPTREHAMEYGRVFGDAVRANPLALGVTAVGIGWLMLGSRTPQAALPDNGNRRLSGVHRSGLRPGSQGKGRLDPSRVGEPSAKAASFVRTAGDAVREAGSSTRETVLEAGSSVRDAVRDARSSARAAVRQASSSAGESAGAAASRIREVAGEVRNKASDALEHTSAVLRDTAGTVYEATRRTAAGVPGRVRHTATTAGDYVRDHPVATAAVLAVGGAALALLLARRVSRQSMDEDVDEVEMMPETPYASGAQADFDAPLRNVPQPLTPEDEGPVYAAGDVSTAAVRPQSEDGDAVGKMEGGNGGLGTISAAASIYPPEASSEAPATAWPSAVPLPEPTSRLTTGDRKNSERTSGPDERTV